MNLYHDVVVKGLDIESSELTRPGACELVFALNEAPPPEWRDVFRRVAHARASATLEHVRFNAGFVTVPVALVQATGIAEDLLAVVRETNAVFRDENAAYLQDEADFANAVEAIDGLLKAKA